MAPPVVEARLEIALQPLVVTDWLTNPFCQINTPLVSEAELQQLVESLKCFQISRFLKSSLKTLEQLQVRGEHLVELTPEMIASITGYSFVLDTLSALNTI